MKNMKNIELNKEEQEFIAENITRFDVVTGIEVNDIEVRIHGKHFGGVGSAAIYRTNDIKAIYAHTHAKCVEAQKRVAELRGSKGTRVLTYEESMER
jgi:uncharacterized protein YycO